MNGKTSGVRMVLAGGSLAGATLVALRGVPSVERRVNAFINRSPDLPAPVVWVPMQFGSLASPFVLGALAYRSRRRSQPALSIITAGFTAWLAAKAVKRAVGRGRPFDEDRSTRLRLGTKTDGSLGFVSGHAAVATAVAGTLSRSTTTGRSALLYVLGGVTGLCRVYVGAHWPIDVVGGLSLGVLISEGFGAISDR